MLSLKASKCKIIVKYNNFPIGFFWKIVPYMRKTAILWLYIVLLIKESPINWPYTLSHAQILQQSFAINLQEQYIISIDYIYFLQQKWGCLFTRQPHPFFILLKKLLNHHLRRINQWQYCLLSQSIFKVRKMSTS